MCGCAFGLLPCGGTVGLVNMLTCGVRKHGPLQEVERTAWYHGVELMSVFMKTFHDLRVCLSESIRCRRVNVSHATSLALHI